MASRDAGEAYVVRGSQAPLRSSLATATEELSRVAGSVAGMQLGIQPLPLIFDESDSAEELPPPGHEVLEWQKLSTGTLLRGILPLILRERWLLLFANVCLLGLAGIESYIPKLLGTATDIAAAGSGANAAMMQSSSERTSLTLNEAMGLMLVLRVGLMVLKFMHGFTLSVVTERILCRLRRRCFENLLVQDIAFFDRAQSGDLTSRLTADMGGFQCSLKGVMADVVGSLVKVATNLSFMVSVSWKITLMTAGLTVLLFAGCVPFIKGIAGYTSLFMSQHGLCLNVLQEGLENIKVVRSCGAEALEQRHFKEVVGSPARRGLCWWWPRRDGGLLRVEVEKGLFENACTTGLFTLAMAGIAGIVWFGLIMVLDGEMSLGDLISFIMYTANLMLAVLPLVTCSANLVILLVTSLRIFQIIYREPEIPMSTGETGRVPDKALGEVSFNDVSFGYTTTILNSMSFVIPGRSSAAFVGTSGSGKSTTLSLIAHFHKASAGSVCVDGHSVNVVSTNWLRRKVAYIQQQPVLFGLSIRENIRYACTAHSFNEKQATLATQKMVEEAAKKANAHDFILDQPAGYDTHCGEGGVRLSGGQKQRVAIARALLMDPLILLMDEATSALDSESESLVQQSIHKISKSLTVISVAHRLGTVRDSDQIMVLDHGVIVGRGTHDELMEVCEQYQDLVKKQWIEGVDATSVTALDM